MLGCIIAFLEFGEVRKRGFDELIRESKRLERMGFLIRVVLDLACGAHDEFDE